MSLSWTNCFLLVALILFCEHGPSHMSWYYSINGEQVGPVSDFRLRELVGSKILQQDTLVWQRGMEQWVKAIDARPDWFQSPAPILDEEAPPIVLAPVIEKREISKPDATYLLRRFAAKIFDIFLISVVVMLFLAPQLAQLGIPEDGLLLQQKIEEDPEFAKNLGLFYMKSFVFQTLAMLVYQTTSLILWAATPGKYIMGLRVVSESGRRLSWQECFWRSALDLLNFVICSGLSYVSIVLDRRRLGIHDRLARTRVVRQSDLSKD